MKYTIFVYLLVASISICKGYNKWTFQLDTDVTVAYISKHNHFGYYNSNFTLCYLYIPDCQSGIYYNASTGNILLVRTDFAYFIKSNLSLKFDSNKNLYDSFDKLYNNSNNYLNLVHGGSALTNNGFDIRLFKEELQKEELQLTTFYAFLENPEVALLLNKNFGGLITDTRRILLHPHNLYFKDYEFTSAGMQIYNREIFGAVIFFGAQSLRNINPSEAIIAKFHDYLYQGDNEGLIEFSRLLIAGKLLYVDEAQALEAEETFNETSMLNEINSMKELYLFRHDLKSHDWYTAFIGGLDPTAIYYASQNVFIIWKYMNDCFMLFDGNSNNYAVYDQWRGAAIVVDKSNSNAIITVKNADKIALYYQRRSYRKAFEVAAKVVNQMKVPTDGNQTFIFNDLVKSAYEFGGNYTYPTKNHIREQLNKFFLGFITNMYRVKGYDSKYKAANAILVDFISIELNDLPTQFVALINKLCTQASNDFNTNTFMKVYDDIVVNANNSFKGNMFNNIL